MLTRSGLMAGAAAMALAGAAAAQDITQDIDEPAPPTAADIEGPQAAVVEQDIAAPPGEEAVEKVLDDAQEEALQNDVHILPTRVREDEIRPWHLWAGEDEGSGVADMRAFMALDRDGDLLLSEAEWDATAPGRADFAALDVNSSGDAGFAEYRVWLALEAAEAANDNANGAGGPLETPGEPESAD